MVVLNNIKEGIYMEVLRIYKMSDDVVSPEYQTKGASGMDLCAHLQESVEIKPLQRVLIPTGIKIELPKNHEAQIRSRSGLAYKSGIAVVNGIGTIDEDYRGEIGIALVNLSDKVFEVNNGDRVAQMVITKVEKPHVAVIYNEEDVSETERGSGGFGSTGV